MTPDTNALFGVGGWVVCCGTTSAAGRGDLEERLGGLDRFSSRAMVCWGAFVDGATEDGLPKRDKRAFF